MKEITNRFGTGILYDESDLGKNIYCICTACMSVWSDFLSFANEEAVKDKDGKCVTPYFVEENSNDVLNPTDTIVVLGCQVTDLAIYNDLKTAKELHERYHNTPIYMGGCLAQRFDIELPDYLRRLDVVRKEYVDLKYVTGFIDYKMPFWNRELKEGDDEFAVGNLFRHMYPLKIGAGCHGKCKYCTIRDTRGETYNTDAYLQVKEFLDHADEGVVVISDSPTVHQIQDWCCIAIRYNKQISFRNVEPQNANNCQSYLFALANRGLLKIFHCPIQSENVRVLRSMNRNIEETLKYIEFAQELRDLGVKVATNIISDYVVDREVIHNMNEDWLNDHFDYWSWNPYFDGNWDYQKAEERFKKYIG